MTTAVLLPGSASTTDFVLRAFPQVLAGSDVVKWSPRGGDAGEIAEQLAGVLAPLGADDPLLIVGVSIGAHAAAVWASEHPRPHTRLILALPAWTGAAAEVAAMTGVAAQRIAENGIAAELARLTEMFPGDWVTEELVRAWGSADQVQLIATLEQTAVSPAPTIDQLKRIDMPTVVLGLHDDPMHPWTVAQQWAQAIPQAELVGLDRASAQVDLTAFGRACQATSWWELGEQTRTRST